MVTPTVMVIPIHAPRLSMDLRKVLAALVVIMFSMPFIAQAVASGPAVATVVLAMLVPLMAVLAFRSYRWYYRRRNAGADDRDGDTGSQPGDGGDGAVHVRLPEESQRGPSTVPAEGEEGG